MKVTIKNYVQLAPACSIPRHLLEHLRARQRVYGVSREALKKLEV
jgi:hypothetical protein